MTERPASPDPGGTSEESQRIRVSKAGSNYVQLEFQIDDIIRRLLPAGGAVGHCGGATAAHTRMAGYSFMSSGLPSISNFERLSRPRWMAVGDRLRHIGLNELYVDGLCGGPPPSHDVIPILTWHARRRREPAAYAYRMLSLHDSVTEDEAVEALEDSVLLDLLTAGLLIREETGRIVSLFDLRFFNGFLIFCDMAHGREAVFGGGPGSFTLSQTVPLEGGIADALDVGCGAGAVALWIAHTARRVLATDINPRAIAMVEVNAAINRIQNVETRLGDLMEPVCGETFDLITAQLPFVPDPGLAKPATYRFGGRYGDELVLRLLSELPRYLAPKGRGVVVCLQPIDNNSASEPWADIQTYGLEKICALRLLGTETNADAFSLRYAAINHNLGVEEFGVAVHQMREHLDRCNIRGFCPVIWLIKHASASAGWDETVQVSGDLWRNVSSGDVERLFAVLELLKLGTPALLRSQLRLVEGVLFFQPYTHEADEADTVYVTLPARSLVRPLCLSRHEWALIQSVDVASNVESAIIAQGGRVDDQMALEAAILTISRALRAGLFDIDGRRY